MVNKVYHFGLGGGEDKISADIDIPNGMARSLYNYEQDYRTGYTRISGYRKLVNDTTPGEGNILGLVVYDDVVYMFRNNVGGGSCGVWKASPAFYNDTVSPATVISNGSWTYMTAFEDNSGVALSLLADGLGYIQPDGYYEFVKHNFKATAKDYGTPQGDWTASTQYYANDIVLDSANVLGYGIDAKLVTYQEHTSSASLLTDTSFWKHIDWVSSVNSGEAHDISGTSGNLYGVDGKNPSFEFDGITFKQIDSTYTNDTPQHIEANGNRLVLGFREGEVAISELGNPHGFDPVYGAGSIGVTDYLTGLIAGPDNILYIMTKKKIYILYGMEGPLDQTELKKHSKNVGAFPYTEQTLGGRTLFWDEWGLTELEATDVFGDVISNSLSAIIHPVLKGKQPLNSVILKDKAQYRSYFQSTSGSSSTTTCLIATLMEDRNLGFTHAVYPFDFHTSTASRAYDLDAHIVGAATDSSDGEVFIMDSGTNFDGASYLSYVRFPYHHMGKPYYTKKFRKVRLNINSPSESTFTGQVDFSYGDSFSPDDYIEETVDAEGSLWGSGTWGAFNWGSSQAPSIESYINGHGENVSLILQTNSSTEKPHTLKDISYIYETLQIEH